MPRAVESLLLALEDHREQALVLVGPLELDVHHLARGAPFRGLDRAHDNHAVANVLQQRFRVPGLDHREPTGIGLSRRARSGNTRASKQKHAEQASHEQSSGHAAV